jgi:hypothetical protein
MEGLPRAATRAACWWSPPTPSPDLVSALSCCSCSPLRHPVSFIHWPSRTSDIELTPVVGRARALQLEVVVVDG